ncbi:uncharacterized protein BT62DRAFT_789134 [Guyanagaster necrorhizus]|uniref:Uncharacterized protein n=1 Tax=Guyanagaster necrorhizus TaxID=856835 RepID=A0A9P8AV99_9AGAR|nr:uncharacterized protein BT62DRAFT_789134 [Guyanagaster necrorhizus MCA 3950]KAG7447697.1 hypothetical protein BT62DRAFT_789134 [Guyanagaster necrorhizus MCA 3950]
MLTQRERAYTIAPGLCIFSDRRYDSLMMKGLINQERSLIMHIIHEKRQTRKQAVFLASAAGANSLVMQSVLYSADHPGSSLGKSKEPRSTC